MQRVLAALAVVTVLAVVAGAGVMAQDVDAVQYEPVVAHIEQLVPVEVTVSVPLDDGDFVTATVPLTVGVALRVEVLGPDVVNIVAEDREPIVAVAA